MPEAKRPLKVFLCHARADRDRVHALYSRLTNDGVDIMPVGYAWLDKEKLLPPVPAAVVQAGQGFDRLNLPDWELEIRKAV